MKIIFESPTKKIFMVPVDKLTSKEAEKLIKKLMKDYSNNDLSWLYEYERKQLVKKRKEKLIKLNGGITTFH